ncbi:MAG: hypothetical protein AAGF56_02415 [Pseudomonadota bacterium]
MPKLRSTLFTVALIFLPIEMCAADELQLGFELGIQLDDARNYASANGWSLRPMSADLPNEWVVDGTDGSLFICENRVLAVRRNFEGTLDIFASMVVNATGTRGLPETTIVTFMVGNVRISNIDARYDAEDGSGLLIQLNSTDGNIGILTNVWSAEDCSEPRE